MAACRLQSHTGQKVSEDGKAAAHLPPPRSAKTAHAVANAYTAVASDRFFFCEETAISLKQDNYRKDLHETQNYNQVLLL
jgi:hypothetical protein